MLTSKVCGLCGFTQSSGAVRLDRSLRYYDRGELSSNRMPPDGRPYGEQSECQSRPAVCFPASADGMLATDLSASSVRRSRRGFVSARISTRKRVRSHERGDNNLDMSDITAIGTRRDHQLGTWRWRITVPSPDSTRGRTHPRLRDSDKVRRCCAVTDHQGRNRVHDGQLRRLAVILSRWRHRVTRGIRHGQRSDRGGSTAAMAKPVAHH